MKGIDDLLKEGSTRRQAVAAFGVAATVGVAGCSSQESTGTEQSEPEADTDSSDSETGQENEEPTEDENQWEDFNPEPMSLLEIAQNVVMESENLYISVYDPKSAEEAYGGSMFPQLGKKVRFEQSGFEHADNPVAINQIVTGSESYEFLAGQLPQGHPRERVVQNLSDQGHEKKISNDQFDILHDGQIASMVNNEIIAVLWGYGIGPGKYVEKAKEIGNNYGQNSNLPSEVPQLVDELEGDDMLSVHRNGKFSYLNNVRERIQPNYAVTKGNMREGIETAWVFDHEEFAEAAEDWVNETEGSTQGGTYYSAPVEANANILYASGNDVGIKIGIDDEIRTLGYPKLFS